MRKGFFRAMVWAALGAALFFAGRLLKTIGKVQVDERNSAPQHQPARTGNPEERKHTSTVFRDPAPNNRVNEDARSPESESEYFPRAADEWQGYRVSRRDLKPCRTTSVCRRGLACRQGKCGACSTSSDCLTGETCVLDHCINSEKVECSHRGDCGDIGPCILIGSTSGRRGNETLQSVCMPETGKNPYHEPPPDLDEETDDSAPNNNPEVQSDLRGAFSEHFPDRIQRSGQLGPRERITKTFTLTFNPPCLYPLTTIKAGVLSSSSLSPSFLIAAQKRNPILARPLGAANVPQLSRSRTSIEIPDYRSVPINPSTI